MIMQLLATAALVTWAVSTAIFISDEIRLFGVIAGVGRSVVTGLGVTVSIFVVTGLVVALGSIALGVQW